MSTPNDAYREALARAREVLQLRSLKPSTVPVSETGGVQRTTITNTDADGLPEDVDDTEPQTMFGHVVR